jgi:hypothetical protein
MSGVAMAGLITGGYIITVALIVAAVTGNPALLHAILALIVPAGGQGCIVTDD